MIRNIVVLGGGSAGLLAALSLKARLPSSPRASSSPLATARAGFDVAESLALIRGPRWKWTQGFYSGGQ